MSDLRGASIWLSREQWGHVIDGLVLLGANAHQRKAANSESTSDVRATEIGDLIAALVSTVATNPCAVRSSVTSQPCLLPDGHPADSPTRFHKYPEATR